MLTLENISYTAEENNILRNINVTINDDEFVAVTGPNGGGKSTLAKIISGITRPSEGKILWNGEDITNLSITDRAKLGISYAFQQPVHFKGMKVRELINLAAGGQADFAYVCDMLSDVGLCAKDYTERDLDGSLSGGELKRIEIASVLARKAKLSVFDEPEAGIDLWSFRNLIQVFERLRQQLHGGILIISHQEKILNIADKILYIKDGEVGRFDDREKVLPMLLKGAELNATCGKLKEKMQTP